jgi:hypothetical protein
MASEYKLHIQFGPSIQFTGEGSEESVREDYKQFLDALPSLQTAISVTPAIQQQQAVQIAEKAPGVDEKLLEQAYIRDGDIVSLRHLPPADRPSRAGDAAILVLYGFKKLLHQDDVLVTKLNESLRTSGIGTARVDRFIGIHSALYRKGGTRSGGRYSLNNQGDLQAEAWLKEWFN